MLPAFGRNGLLPPGEHLCEWPEFVLRFGGTPDNGRRKRLLLGLAQMLVLLGQAGCRMAYVDGSFISRERWPHDFDVCYEEEGINEEIIDPCFSELSSGRDKQKRRFHGEAFPVNFPFDWSGQTVREAFTRSRNGQLKGLVRLELWLIGSQIEQWLNDIEGGTDGTPT